VRGRPQIYAADAKVLANEKVTSWKLKAFKYYYMPLKEIGLGGIVVEPTNDLIRLQKALMDATAPFLAPACSGTAALSRPPPTSPRLTSPPSTRLQPTFPDTLASITTHTSPSVWAQEIIWMHCSPRRSQRSRFRPWECQPTSSATSEPRQNNSTPSS
jgi:hypothetical protein